MISLFNVCLSSSNRCNFLYKNRDVMAGIIKKFCPDSLYSFKDENTLFIVTSDNVNTKSLARELRISESEINVYNYDRIIDKALNSGFHNFEVVMYPRIKHNGKEIFVNDDDLESWFKDKMEQFGVKITHVKWDRAEFVTIKPFVRIKVRQFVGRLQVTDKEAFEKALIFGVSRGKLAGCGLLLLDDLAGV